jgi:hypothetical protein
MPLMLPSWSGSLTQSGNQMVAEVSVALECAEAATLAVNDLVGRTLETAVTGKEAATTMHHAYSAQVLVARVLDWSKEWAQMDGPSEGPPPKLDDCLTWMRRARDHAEKLCRCFPPSDVNGNPPKVADWADRWSEDYWKAKSLAEKSLQKIETAIDALQHQLEELGGGKGTQIRC